jgi:methanogenic corrinoid protein MtbC1
VDVNLDAAKQRVARLARTIEAEVIPRLVQQHRDPSAPVTPLPTLAEVGELVQALVANAEPRVTELLEVLHLRGVGVDSIYLDLLAPAARKLGELWEDDRVDFATVTVSLGRLQRLLRLLSPGFGDSVLHPANGRRVLLTQPDQELHMFGLAMVAEFFRREGWDVLGGVAGVGIDAVKWVGRDWFDVVGFSLGNEQRLPWLRDNIAELRQRSRNADIVVLVGGPVFTMNPSWSEEVGADATTDGRTAPVLAETMLARRVQQVGQSHRS